MEARSPSTPPISTASARSPGPSPQGPNPSPQGPDFLLGSAIRLSTRSPSLSPRDRSDLVGDFKEVGLQPSADAPVECKHPPQSSCDQLAEAVLAALVPQQEAHLAILRSGLESVERAARNTANDARKGAREAAAAAPSGLRATVAEALAEALPSALDDALDRQATRHAGKVETLQLVAESGNRPTPQPDSLEGLSEELRDKGSPTRPQLAPAATMGQLPHDLADVTRASFSKRKQTLDAIVASKNAHYERVQQVETITSALHDYESFNGNHRTQFMEDTKHKNWVLRMFNMALEPRRTSQLARFLRSDRFEKFLAVIIILNVVFIGHSADYAIAHPQQQVNQFIVVAEISFSTMYMCEIVLRIAVRRIYFFVGEDWNWNCFDFFLVLLSVYDTVMSNVLLMEDVAAETSGQGSGISASFFRCLRLLRLGKIFRAFRVMRFFRELRMMLASIAASMRSLFWCMVMLTLFYYIFAIMFVNAARSVVAGADFSPPQKDMVMDYWGSTLTSMLSLYKASTGGIDWSDAAEPLVVAGKIYYATFLFFIAFIILAVLNILTGIFVENAMRAAAHDRDGHVMEEMDVEHGLVRNFTCIFVAILAQRDGSCFVEDDWQSSGTITAEDFEEYMISPTARALMSVLGLEVWDPRAFFQMMVAHGQSHHISSGKVDNSAFVLGCMQLRGQAKCTDIVGISTQLDAITKAFQEMRAQLHKAEAAGDNVSL